MLEELKNLLREGWERVRDFFDPAGNLKPQPVPVPVRVNPRNH